MSAALIDTNEAMRRRSLPSAKARRQDDADAKKINKKNAGFARQGESGRRRDLCIRNQTGPTQLNPAAEAACGTKSNGQSN